MILAEGSVAPPPAEGLMQLIQAWIEAHNVLIGWIAGGSLALTLGTIVALPFIVARIPDDYFATRERPPLAERTEHFAFRWLLRIGKNLAGLSLIVIGLVLSIPLVPGQGLITAFAGLLLLEFPGKRRFEMWVIRKRGVLHAINWLREHRKRPPLIVWTPD